MAKGICDSTCNNCLYLGYAGRIKCCDYIIFTEHSRGCPAGKGCDKRKKTTENERLLIKRELGISRNFNKRIKL